MNILLVVMTFLMVLTVMTYARIESIRDTLAVQAQFELAMQKNVPKAPSAIAKKRYKTTPAKKMDKQGEDKETKEQEEELACSKISFYFFVNKKERENRQSETNQLLTLSKRLMQNLYGKYPFFKEAEDKNPDLLNELMSRLMEKIEELPKEERVTYTKDLANVEFDDLELDTVFYQMLKGTEEEKGYPSLLDFITLKNKSKIRIYLASEPVLNTLYDNPDFVKHIITTRNELYSRIKAKKMTPKDATAEFESQFSGKQRAPIDNSLLDFTVSKSNPKDYS